MCPAQVAAAAVLKKIKKIKMQTLQTVQDERLTPQRLGTRRGDVR